jgi:toxin ParE1/3/4
MHLRWTPAAVADLQHISDYLKEHHPRYRQPTVRKLYEAILGLKKWPQRGRIGREEGTREFLFSPLPYVVVYRLTGQSVEVFTHLSHRAGSAVGRMRTASASH